MLALPNQRWNLKFGVERHDIAPAKPIQTDFSGSMNGRMRSELPNETPFMSLAHARAVIVDYNRQKPHSSLGYATAAAFASASHPAYSSPSAFFRVSFSTPAAAGLASTLQPHAS